MLARYVTHLATANNQLTADVESLKQQLAQAMLDNAELKSQLETTGQPQRVFVATLSEK
jgi:cell division protein FtsL